MKLWRHLVALLASFLALGVDPPADPPIDPPADPPANVDPPGDDDDLPDLDADDPPADPPADPPTDHQALLRAATDRAERAEREAREHREARAELERTRGQPAQQNNEQRLFQEEEEKLRNSNTSATERWQIESNRTLRASRRAAEQALFQSQEASDRAAFDRLKGERPLAKKYEKRVEDKLAEIRKDGQNLPRNFVLAMLIGMDIVEGKVTTKKKAAAPGIGDPPPTQRVNRGAPPHSRSDVRARSGASEQDKRRARLQDQII